jgi:hypothetical protein
MFSIKKEIAKAFTLKINNAEFLSLNSMYVVRAPTVQGNFSKIAQNHSRLPSQCRYFY